MIYALRPVQMICAHHRLTYAAVSAFANPDHQMGHLYSDPDHYNTTYHAAVAWPIKTAEC